MEFTSSKNQKIQSEINETHTKGLVSIIIPCYKQGKYLPECIESIKSQTYKNWEIIIIDDGSPDETEIIFHKISSEIKNIRYIKKNNGGLSSARNAGLLICKGEYIQFLDADDLLEPNKIEFQINFLSNNIGTDIVYGNAKYFDDAESTKIYRSNLSIDAPNIDWIDRLALSSGSTLNKIINGNLFPVCAAILRKKVFYRVGLFNEALSSHEDWEIWVRMALQNAIFNYKRRENTDALIRVHPNSLSQNKKNMQYTIAKTRLNFSNIIPSEEKLAREINIKKLLLDHQTFNSISFKDYLKLLTRTRALTELKIHLIYLRKKLKQLTSAIQ